MSVITEDEKQKYFEEGYDQCFREVIDEVQTWKHPDTKSMIMWLKDRFKLSAATINVTQNCRWCQKPYTTCDCSSIKAEK